MSEKSSQALHPVTPFPGGPASVAQPDDASHELAGMNLLFRVVNLMHASMDPLEIARITLTAMTAGSALGMNRAAVLLCDHENGTLRGHLAVGPGSREEAFEIWHRISESQESFEELARSAVESVRSPQQGSLSGRVSGLRYPLADVPPGALARALEGETVCFSADDPLPADLRAIFDGEVGLVVPLRSVDRVLGLVVADRFVQGECGMGECMALATEVARQAGLALGNAYQLTEVQVRAAQLAALHELGKKFLGSQDLAQNLRVLARCASEVTSARACQVWLAGEKGFTPEARWQVSDALQSPELDAALLALAQRAAATGGVALVRDASAADAPAGLLAARSVVCAPLLAYGRVIGAVAVYDRIPRNTFDVPAFDRSDRDFLCTLTDQAAIALENLRLLDRFKSSERQLRETQALLLHNEKLAALGEMSAKVAHEIRNPLAAIGGFARRVVRTLGRTDPNRESVEVIVRETERLERILTEQLQFAQLSRPRLRVCDVNQVLNETLQLMGPALVERRVRLVKRLGPDIPGLLLDADKIKQVLLNIIQNALQNVSQGGRVKVETRRLPQAVQVEVANDGPKIAGDILERLFVPFSTSRPGGSGLGLAVADQIVREHGGEIRVKSSGDWGCSFCVLLPLEDSKDRRERVADRRSREREDRRQAPADE